MSPKARMTTALALIAIACLLVPPLALAPFGAADLGEIAGFGALGIAFTTITLGRRGGFIATAALAIVGAIGLMVASHPVAAVILMAASAVAYGWTARIGANHATVLLPIALAFIVNYPDPADRTQLAPPLLFTLTALASGLLATLAVSAAAKPMAAGPSVSRSRATGFITLLTLTTIVTTTISVGGDWGHAGGWMVMTPFIVIQPYMQDGWRKALRRAAGTIGGFVIAMALATVLGNSWVLIPIGVAFAVAAITAYVRRVDYGIYALLLTPAIVILEGFGTSVEETAVKRLEATLIGVGLSLLAMAIALPLYRRKARANSLTHY